MARFTRGFIICKLFCFGHLISVKSFLDKDAHNSILDFDTDTSLFAVYDGHGGHEVAAYCAEHLPEFLKKLQSYSNGDISKALEEAYLEFDHRLTKESVVKTLHVIAGK